jgi:hypothetical protein
MPSKPEERFPETIRCPSDGKILLSLKRLRAQNQVALRARVVFGLETKKIIKIRLLTPPTVFESERGPPRDHQEFNSSNEVRVTLLVNVRDIIPQTRHQTGSPTSDDSRYDKSTVSPTTARAREALAIDLEVQDFLVDEELATRAIPTRIYAHKSCARAYEYAPTRSSTIGQLLPAAVVASKQCRRPKSRGSNVRRAVSARTRRRPRPRKS